MATTLESDIPEEVRSWIDQKRYAEESEYCVERGYIMTSCASVANGNPLFWDEDSARETTAGWIAPPSMLAVWTRPHYWSPGGEKTNLSLRVHFDLKEQLELPEGIITGNSIVFGVPARVGDREGKLCPAQYIVNNLFFWSRPIVDFGRIFFLESA